MTIFRGADEIVIGKSHPVPQSAELCRNLVGQLLRRLARGLRRPLDLLPMLVGAGQEIGVYAQHALAPRHRIASDGRVSMTNVRPCIDVVDRSRNVKLVHCVSGSSSHLTL